MKRLLFIAHRMPFPPNKGDKIRSCNILQYLSTRYIVDVAFLVDNVSDLIYLDQIKNLSNHVFYDVIKKDKKIKSAIAAFFKNTSISVPYFYSKNIQESLDGYFEKNIPACIFCFSSPSAEYVFKSRYCDRLKENSSLVMDLIDLDSLKWSQYAERASGIMAHVYHREAKLLAEYEEKIAQVFDGLLLVSEPEKQLCPPKVREKITVVTNGVDLEKFAPGKGKAKNGDGPVVVFTGAMDYWPNIDAVTWFVKEIFPLILANESSTIFLIVGANPTPEVLKLSKYKNVVVTGFVEDIRDYIAAADVCVAPLRIARGIQNKVLEAMAMGKAVVATAYAIEGIVAESSRQVLIADTAECFANAVLLLLHDENKRNFLGKGARESMELNYSWESNLAQLDHLLP